MAYNAGASSGNLVLLNKQTPAGVSEIVFTSLITTAYDDYVVKFNSLTGAGGITFIQLQFSTTNGSSYLTAGNYFLDGVNSNSGSQGFAFSPAQTGCRMASNFGASPSQACGRIELFNISSGSFVPVGLVFDCGSNLNVFESYSVGYNSAQAVNAIKIIADGGTFSGTFKLYGVAN